MNAPNAAVIGGVDTHSETHHAAVIDINGRHLGDAQFPATPAGYAALGAFLSTFGVVVRVGIEGTGSYGAGLFRHGNRFYGPLTGIAPGEVAVLTMTLAGRLTLPTGVMVLYADLESFTLMTPEGHMFAGWIKFSATDTAEHTVARRRY